ncbi:MAG: ornithine--oxo-acid transaminase [Desulfovibrionaceae bacterium]
MNSREYIELEDRYGAHNYKPLDVVLSRGQGVWVWDVDGKRYMDCLSAYSAVNQGHCHPSILAAMNEQAKKLTLTSRAFRNDQLGPFYKEICELTNSHKVLPMNSGAEAVETVIKAVRKWAYTIKGVPEDKAEIIVCENNFHGRTITIVGFSSHESYKEGFGPFTPGFRLVPFGDAEAVAQAVNENTAGVLVEPIQGEGGIVIPPEGYLRELRRICDENQMVLALDEIQTGLGRTGKLFAEEYDGIEADATLVGKALSGGFYPVSAVLANTEVLSVFMPGEHGSTFGGNPLGCAVARAALKVLVEEGLMDNAVRMGAKFMDGLAALNSPVVAEVRGRGLLIGVELAPEAGGARGFCEALRELGILCNTTREHVIRLAPPLTITEDEADWALERLGRVLQREPGA